MGSIFSSSSSVFFFILTLYLPSSCDCHQSPKTELHNMQVSPHCFLGLPLPGEDFFPWWFRGQQILFFSRPLHPLKSFSFFSVHVALFVCNVFFETLFYDLMRVLHSCCRLLTLPRFFFLLSFVAFFGVFCRIFTFSLRIFLVTRHKCPRVHGTFFSAIGLDLPGGFSPVFPLFSLRRSCKDLYWPLMICSCMILSFAFFTLYFDY